jgi:hypothetical protein
VDHQLAGITVEQFRMALRDAVDRIDVVQPAALREPVSLWLRSVEAQAAGQQWKHLLGRPVIAAWNAAHAILDEQ